MLLWGEEMSWDEDTADTSSYKEKMLASALWDNGSMFSYSTLDGLVAGTAATATLFCASPRPEQVVLISIRWPDTPYSCDNMFKYRSINLIAVLLSQLFGIPFVSYIVFIMACNQYNINTYTFDNLA